MPTITAQMVKNLREKTDLPMMECKQALSENDGNVEAAMDWLRRKHKGKLADRADRATGEGRIGVYIDDAGKVGALVELQCETAPVGKNELFVDLANAFAQKAAQSGTDAPDLAALREDPQMDRMFTEVYGKLRETMNLTRATRITGQFLASYVHHDGKSGVLLALSDKPGSDKNIGGDLCMHALFTKPIAIDRAGVPAVQVEKVRQEAIDVARAEGKPEQIVDKIANGKVNAFYGERVLMEQLHVKTDDYGKTKVADVLEQAGVGAVTALAIMKVGE